MDRQGMVSGDGAPSAPRPNQLPNATGYQLPWNGPDLRILRGRWDLDGVLL